MFDVLIRNGWLVDGTGNPAYPADVGVEGDTIAAVGRFPEAQARRVINAKGKLVTPGFVDCHSHTDWSIQTNPTAQSTIRPGVTTEIVGHCGVSNAPNRPSPGRSSVASVVTRPLRKLRASSPLTLTTPRSGRNAAFMRKSLVTCCCGTYAARA